MYTDPKVYAVKHRNIHTRMASRSGGIFTALSDYVLEKNGVVYGCILNDKMIAVHSRAATVEERNKMRGSKYIQSDIGDTFISAKKDLDNGSLVLFSGTSCQLAALKSFLGVEYNNLLCVDILCHSVPSPVVWKSHVSMHEKANNAECIEADFRNKKEFGWGAHIETLYLKKNEKVISDHNTDFVKLFYKAFITRPSCSKCPYKSINHPSDITIADYWGIEKAAPGFSDNKGVSLVLINSEKGEDIFKAVSENLELKKTSINNSMQMPLVKPYPDSKRKSKFWSAYYEKGYSYAAKKYTKETIGDVLIKYRKKIINKVLRLAKRP